ncbi:hypothetical protein IMZ31_23360 (plasmid) [Pontibacillus sp. ALD_SL1]|uniref:hypothetical protein n=1 Tax=Pontibacillus sp. ALD_SL1 TaxID=2777185 RepID=UPI001A95F8E9|nr:hypothetical protein [Pontibacillus sp. ALD_SL1]QST02391.1 hypothetical protein IMZ31_23360 [Pontibacillus sp. ALD_SL1]
MTIRTYDEEDFARVAEVAFIWGALQAEGVISPDAIVGDLHVAFEDFVGVHEDWKNEVDYKNEEDYYISEYTNRILRERYSK